jgi:hypothetical protein
MLTKWGKGEGNIFEDYREMLCGFGLESRGEKNVTHFVNHLNNLELYSKSNGKPKKKLNRQ